MIVNFR